MNTDYNKKTSKYSDNNIRNIFLKLFPIQAFAVGLPAINCLIDSCIIGNYLGTAALATVGFTAPLIWFLYAISGIFSSGTQILCGQKLGKGDRLGTCSVYSTCLLACILVGLVLVIITQTFPRQLAILMGAQNELIDMTADYIKGIGCGIVFLLLNTCLLQFNQLQHSDKISSIAIIALLIVNIGGDMLNVLVFHGGIYGMGLSTSISFIVSTMIAFSGMINSKLFRFVPKEIHLKTLAEICYIGSPYALGNLCLMIRSGVVNHYVYMIGGNVAMSAIAIAENINTAIGCVCQAGYSGGGSLLSSLLVGQRDTSTLRDLPKIMAKAAGWIFVAAYLVVFVFSGSLAHLFGADSVNIDFYKMVIRLYNIWYITNIIKTPPICIYQAMGKIKLMSAFIVFNNLIAPVGICLLFGNNINISMIASIPWISEFLLILMYAISFTIQAKRLPRSLFELTYIPSSISAHKKNRFKATIQTIEDATATSAKVTDFCIDRGIDKRTANYCGLCVEEMTVDTIINGFKDDKGTIDLRIIVQDGMINILLRDTGTEFDPVKWIELHEATDEGRNLGLNMVSKLSKKMSYVSALGMNILTITI